MRATVAGAAAKELLLVSAESATGNGAHYGADDFPGDSRPHGGHSRRREGMSRGAHLHAPAAIEPVTSEPQLPRFHRLALRSRIRLRSSGSTPPPSPQRSSPPRCRAHRW